MPAAHFFIGFLACWTVLCTTFDARAAKSCTPFGAEQPVTIEDFQPHLSGVEGYSEEWSHGIWLDDGGFIGIDFGITNIALTSDHDGRFKASLKDAQGKEVKCISYYDDDEWSAYKSRFGLRFGTNEVEGDLNGLRLKVRCKKLKMDLVLENKVKPFKPGSGVLRFGDHDGTYRIVYTSPRAHVTGSAEIEGKTREIKGIGNASHSYYDIRPDKNVLRWFRFSLKDRDLLIILAEMESTAEYGNARNGWAIVMDETGRIVATARVNFVHDGLIRDTKSKDRYLIPRRVRFLAVDGDNSISGVLLMQRIEKIRDITSEMGVFKRAIVRRFAKPRDYRIACSYKLTIKRGQNKEELEGESSYRFVFTNPL